MHLNGSSNSKRLKSKFYDPFGGDDDDDRMDDNGNVVTHHSVSLILIFIIPLFRRRGGKSYRELCKKIQCNCRSGLVKICGSQGKMVACSVLKLFNGLK